MCYSVAENAVYVTTPPVNVTTHRVTIKLEISNGSVGSLIDTKHTFEYRGNPVFDDIRPRSHLLV